MIPTRYDIKTIAKKLGKTPRDVLLLAHEEKLPLGIYVRNQTVLFLQNGKNIHIESGDNALKRAYEGSCKFTGILYLNHRHINALLHDKTVYSDMFLFYENGYDEALLLLGEKSYQHHITIDILFSETKYLEKIDLKFNPEACLKIKKRAENDLTILIREKTKSLAAKLGKKPSAKELLRALEEEKKANGSYDYPIEKIDGNLIYWKNGKENIISIEFRTLENKLSKI